MFWRGKPTWLRVVVVVVALIVAMSSVARASRSQLLSRPIDDILLEQHNIFRQEEKAANIFKMHWNESVAAAARDWASKCHFKHLLSGPYGENLFYSSDPSFEDFDIREILLEGLELWHDEKRGWTYSSSACGAACHYTQMVWSTTTSVGCANQMCHGLKVGRRNVDRALYLVCFYYPRGNWVGEYPFKRGRPCSDCGDGTCQDGLCVKERATFSSYHTRSENEVKSGSTWNWKYSARDQDSHHQASSFRNVSNVISRDPNQNAFRHTSSRHSQHNISVKTPTGHHHSRHTSSSSVYRVSHDPHSQQEIQLQERGLTYSSRGSLDRDLESYNPSRSRLPSLAPAALRQAPRQAQYARPALERIGNNNNNHNNHINHNNNNNNRREILADGRRSQSPLEVLRADTHWCRDRLPSCRIWTRDCLKSKAVYLACPRTCGHCGKNKDKEKPNALRDRPPPSPRAPSHPPSPRHPQVRTTQQHRQQQQQRSRPQHRAPQQQQHRPTPTSHRRLQRPTPQQQQQQHLRKHHRNNTVDRRRGRKNGAKRQHKRQRNGRRKANLQARKRQGGKNGRGPGKRNGNGNGKRNGHGNGNGNGKRRNRPLGQRRKEGRRQQRHKKFQNVDRRAQKLAKDLRMKALDGARCEDDPKYTRSCPSWVRQGFCNGNVLVSDVYCKLSCQSC